MLYWDLHVHTEWSDGSTPVEDVVAYAANRGLRGIAITDHDAMDMTPVATKRAEKYGLEIIPATELSSLDAQTGRKVHLLVYFPQVIERLEPIFDTMAQRRQKAGEEMIALLAKRYPITSEMIRRHAERSKTIYRVHLLRALMEMGYAQTVYGPLYKALFGRDGTCLKQVEYFETFTVAKAARESGGAVILAHPEVYDSFGVAERLAIAGLIDGIEYRYPRKSEEMQARHDRLVREYGLLTTGGTDYHGFYTTRPNPVGTCTTTEYELSLLHKLIVAKGKKHDV